MAFTSDNTEPDLASNKIISNKKKLVNILKEMFQFDQADLDFGIYRIMQMKRSQITNFLEKELPKQITEDLKALPTSSADVEADVYNRLTDFFSRYYDEGDFISQRRYKEGAYAIPYEGEEVKLHWANADQYYVKTSEYFKDYTFKTDTGETVHFKLHEAETEQDNNKAKEKRFFQLHTDKPFEVIGDALYIYVEYKEADNKNQKTCSEEIVEEFKKGVIHPEYQPFLDILKETDEKTLLERQLDRYTAKNTFDYFIHKDLGKFLRRELDFYIKNDVIYLDDIELHDEAKTREYLTKAKVIRKIAQKIITFLAQLENFQKKLWLKKKFVVETNYCITLDRVPKDMYPEIAANAEQRKEWVRLFAIDEIKGPEVTIPGLGKTSYSEPLTDEFLKENPFLVLDTAFFSTEFKERLIGSLDDFDEQCDGLLIHSENFQALQLLQERYREQIKCIYIDPPFNLEKNGDFLYRTDYKDSTWATILEGRLSVSRKLLSNDGIQFIRCDVNGNAIVRLLCNQIFGPDLFANELLVQRIRKNVTKQGKITIPLSNDSIFLYYNSINSQLSNPYKKLDSTRQSYWRRIDDSAGFRNPPERNIFGKIFLPYKNDAHFKYSQESIDKMISEKRIRLICKECDYEHYEGEWKCCLNCGKNNCTPQYLVEETDQIVLDSNWMDIPGYSAKWGFSTENALPLIMRVVSVGSGEKDIVMDYFAGSGTTGHAVIALNREEQKQRKFILVEMGEYFDRITRARIEKVMYSATWSNKSPILRDGSSLAFKYLRLESYEDALNNIEFRERDSRLPSGIQEEYLLSYMLETESGESACLLNLERLHKPFSYEMNIARNLESQKRSIDLVETFNYLIGLRVRKSHALVSFDADFIPGKYGAISATPRVGKTYKFKAVEGALPNGEETLVIWREMTDDVEKDNAVLDAYFLSLMNGRSFKHIYVNCDNNLLNLRGEDENWRVELIDVEMKKRMFEETE